MRRPLSRRGRLVRVLAPALGVLMVLSACSSQPTVTVTITKTPGADQVTVASLPASPSAGSGSSASQNGSSPQGGASGSGSQDSGGSKDTGKPAPTTSSAPKMRVSANPAFGTKKIAPNDPITVTVFNAELQKVTMIGDDGSAVDGKITNDKHTWNKTERLKYGVKYTMTGTAKGVDGSTQHLQGTFSTVKPKETMAAYIQIPNGDTVGVAAPIVITFAGVVKDRAAAEKHLHVTINGGKKIAGSWGWMLDEDIQGKGHKQSRVHFRPAPRNGDIYWPANAKVHLEADLYGVDYGNAWGREDLVRNFKIGPKLVLQTNVPEHRLYLLKDGNVIENFAVAYGKESVPGRNTVSGIHVITQKKPGKFKMCNLAYDYCGVTEYWGLRINNNGEFIHGNVQVEKEGLLGKANVSHGCINMSKADAKKLFHMVYYGVPVDVRGTGVKMSYADYIWDWSVPYSTWKTFSAL